MPDYVVIATWPFGQTAVKPPRRCWHAGQPALDAASPAPRPSRTIRTVHSVGYGGLGNAVGDVSLDACVMDGQTLACGAVAGLENIRHAAALARRVMEKTPHVLLVGSGAKQFALQQGFPLETLHTPESVAEWEKTKPQAEAVAGPPDNHDTVTVLALDKKGSLGGVCTTSGLAHKLPGRVGDSPLIGAGLYVDDDGGGGGRHGRRRGDHPHRRQPADRGGDARGQVAAGGVRAGGEEGQRRGGAARRASGGGGVYRAGREGPLRRCGDDRHEVRVCGRASRPASNSSKPRNSLLNRLRGIRDRSPA